MNTSSSTSSGPSQVLIVRHGEKLGDPSSDSSGGPDLSVRGSARAAALPALFAPATSELSCVLAHVRNGFTGTYITIKQPGTAPRFATPAFIFATAPSSSSNRPVETITPTGTALQVDINPAYSDSHKEIKDMATLILTSSKYAGSVVLICWHHGTIPKLAEDLGIPTKDQPPWTGSTFDRVWQITYDSKGKASLQNLPQQLLYGDSAT